MMKKKLISVIVPLYNEEEKIKRLIDSINNQKFKNFELIIVDDCSKDNSYYVAKKYENHYIHVLRSSINRGPAKTRNKGIRLAKSDIIAFIDSDAWPENDWLEKIYSKFCNKDVQVVMGSIKIPKSTYLGDSISAQGFPGGANLGFEKMWKVKNGLTNHITSCNFAIRNSVLKKYGLFDESFPLPGGEDPELSFRLSQRGVPINYFSDVKVYHQPMTSFNKWVRWQIKRGRSNYHFKRKVKEVNSFISLRVWSSWNIIRTYFFDVKFPLISLLLLLSFVLQQYGYIIEKFRFLK
jgi:glycosyltransferase involved in cell wall biosynthesis